MTKDVLVSVKGIHNNGMDADDVEMINQGQFYRRNGRVYIKYEEAATGFSKTSNSMIKVSEHCVEITKKGLVNTHMVFILDERVTTFYESPYGAINMVVNTDILNILDADSLYRIELGYDMEVNGQYLSRCHVIIKVVPKNDKNFTLIDH